MKPNYFSYFVPFLMSLLIISAIGIDGLNQVKHDQTTHFVRLLTESRLTELSKNLEMQGSGGYRVKLPSGNEVSRDTLFFAIREAVHSKDYDLLQVVAALTHDHEHIRSGASLFLRIRYRDHQWPTKNCPLWASGYGPKQNPSSKETIATQKAWEKFVTAQLKKQKVQSHAEEKSTPKASVK